MWRSRSMAASTPRPRRLSSLRARQCSWREARSSIRGRAWRRASRRYATRLADQDSYKRAAAEKALELVRDGMLLGLGSGTTVRFFTEGVGRLVSGGMKIRGVPTSRATAELAAASGIPVVEDLVGLIDLAVDGADEVDPRLNLIKGRGGALFRE